MQPRQNVALRSLTTFGVAGTAAQAWTLDRLDQIDALREALGGRLPFILGGGSNILFARDLHEPVVLVRLAGRRLVEDDGTRIVLEVGAGEGWDDTVRYSLSEGWFGLENLSSIPGLVGGAPWQNIGAYGVEVAEFIQAVDAVDTITGERRRFTAMECAFDYRSSFFKTQAGRRWLITSVRLRLSREVRPRVDYGEVRQEIEALGAWAAGEERGATEAVAGAPGGASRPTSPSPQQVAAAVRSIRRRRLPDPAVLGNAGSFFKNPIVSLEDALRLRTAFPGAPAYPVPGDATRLKLSAAWLIESAGWKGFRDGDAGVSAQHALVLVNHGNATGRQLLALARRIQQSVLERFGISLEPEPVIVA